MCSWTYREQFNGDWRGGRERGMCADGGTVNLISIFLSVISEEIKLVYPSGPRVPGSVGTIQTS